MVTKESPFCSCMFIPYVTICKNTKFFLSFKITDVTQADEPQAKKRKYEFRDRRIYAEALKMNDREFLRRFRVSRKVFSHICDLIRDELPEGRSFNNRSLSAEERLLIFLFSAGTSISNFNAAYAHNVSEGTVHACLDQVMDAINKIIVPMYIKLPTRAEALEEAKAFQDKHNFPPKPHAPIVIGAIDGTHVLVTPPEDKKIECVNRHGTHSLNCMIFCGGSFKIYAATANSMGAAHDAAVFQSSELYDLLTIHNYEPIPNCVIVADQAYPDSISRIATSFLEGVAMNNEAMKEYNEGHIGCRLCAEQCNGVVKRRFPSLRKGLEFRDLDRCTKFVMCCLGCLNQFQF